MKVRLSRLCLSISFFFFLFINLLVNLSSIIISDFSLSFPLSFFQRWIDSRAGDYTPRAPHSLVRVSWGKNDKRIHNHKPKSNPVTKYGKGKMIVFYFFIPFSCWRRREPLMKKKRLEISDVTPGNYTLSLKNLSTELFRLKLAEKKVWMKRVRQRLPVQAKIIDDVARWTLRYLPYRYGNKRYFPACFPLPFFLNNSLWWSERVVKREVRTIEHAFLPEKLHTVQGNLFLSIFSVERA